MTDHSPPVSGNLRGIALMLVSMAGFAIEDVFIKLLAREMGVAQILILLGIAGGALFAIWTLRSGQRLLSADLLARPVILRNLCETAGTLCFVTALALAPLSSVAAVLQSMPLVVTLGAVLFLGERVGWRRWSAIFVGFAGVLMIIRPGMEAFQPASLFAVGAALWLGLRDLATRATPPAITSTQLATYAYVAVTLAGIVLLPFGPDPVLPSATGWALVLAATLVGVIAYYAITAAMRVGDVAVITPFRYSRLVFALILAVLIFGERPDAMTLTGAAVIIASGLVVILREGRGSAEQSG